MRSMSQPTIPDRRRFLGTAAAALAAAPFAMSGAVFAQSGSAKPGAAEIRPGTHTSFAALKQIEAGVLTIGYAEAGPADGPDSLQERAASMTASAKACGASCGRLCPMPPVIRRWAYLPENFPA